MIDQSTYQPLTYNNIWLRGRIHQTHPVLIVLGVLLCVLATIVIKLRHLGFDPASLANIDGVFVLRLAHSLPSLHAEVDVPAYRAQRILLSMLAAPFGSLIPWALIAINLASIGAGTYAFARLGQRTGTSTLLGCLFGLWIGTLYALHMDLTEILTYALVAWGIVRWEEGRIGWAVFLCGIAALGKETAVLYVGSLLLGSQRLSWTERARVALFGLSPMLFWQSILLVVLGTDGIRSGMNTAGAGMMPVVGYLYAKYSEVEQIIWIAAPSLVAVCWGIWRLVRGPRDACTWALLLNGLFVLSLPPASTAYLVHSSRIGLAVVVALAWATARTHDRRWVLLLLAFMLLPTLLFRVSTYL